MGRGIHKEVNAGTHILSHYVCQIVMNLVVIAKYLGVSLYSGHCSQVSEHCNYKFVFISVAAFLDFISYRFTQHI